MEYKCKTMTIAQINVGPNGFIMPICETCDTRDCTNPIEKTKISILGVTKEIRIFSRGTEQRFVVQCEGYVNA